MPEYSLRDAARLLGVSDDTVRRWVDAGRLRGSATGGRKVVDGVELARFAVELADAPATGHPDESPRASARNHFTGLVTRVVADTVMAQVELQCGPYRVVSLISREAVDELGLAPGVVATASVKATNVGIELPR